MIISLILSLFTLASAADLDESFNCKGNFTVQRVFSKKAFRANDEVKSFSFFRKDTNSILVSASTIAEPIVEIFPWDGIHFETISKGKFAKDIKIEIDRDQSFDISLKTPEKNFSLNCRIFD